MMLLRVSQGRCVRCVENGEVLTVDGTILERTGWLIESIFHELFPPVYLLLLRAKRPDCC
jgi:hypothetical protein